MRLEIAKAKKLEIRIEKPQLLGAVKYRGKMLQPLAYLIASYETN